MYNISFTKTQLNLAQNLLLTIYMSDLHIIRLIHPCPLAAEVVGAAVATAETAINQSLLSMPDMRKIFLGTCYV